MLETMYLAILIGAGLVMAAVFTSWFAFRFGAPILLIFLAVGLLAGEDGLGIEFDNSAAAYFLGSLALAIILFNSGFGTKLSTFRQAALPAIVLATVGVVLTTAICWRRRRVSRSGFPWLQSLPARRGGQLDRRGGGVLPAARRRHPSPRPRALGAGGGIRRATIRWRSS